MTASNKVQEITAVDLGGLLDAGDGALVTLEAGETQLVAHTAVLAARSPVFAGMFQRDTLESSGGRVSITDVEGAVLRQLLAYCYTLQSPELPGVAPQLLAAAEKYGVLSLKTQCEQQLGDQLSVENAAATAVLAVSHCCPRLMEVAVAFIKGNPEVLATQGWADVVCTQSEDVVKVSWMLAETPEEFNAPPPITTEGSPTPGTARQSHSDHGCQTPAAAVSPKPLHHTPPPDKATVSQMQSLSREERGRKLIQAAKQGALQELQAFLVVGADLGTRDGGRTTALHWAADQGHVEAVRCLIGGGAEVDTRTILQETPLHMAAYWGHTTVVQLLLVSSADPNARDWNGRTPLHDAAINGHADAIAALLEAGADKGAVDDDGNTPLDDARQYSKQQLVEMLT